MSQRKLLTNAECLHNVRQLAKVNEKAKSLYDHARVNELFELVQYQLFEESIVLGIKSELQQLKTLIMNALALNYSNAVLVAEMKRWIEHYRAAERAETAAMRSDAAKARGKNITDSLIAGDPVDSVWGDDQDLQTVLAGYITNPEDPNAKFFSGETYVLPPAPITTTDQAAAIAKQIRLVCSKAPVGKNMTLLIPVNQDQLHWQLLSVELNMKKITKAQLIDSSKSQLFDATLANLQTIVTKVNAGKAKDTSVPYERAAASSEKVTPPARIISPVITNVRTEGNKCMHAVAQQVFKRARLRDDDVTAKALANAATPLDLLTGVVGKIYENKLSADERKKDSTGKVTTEEVKAKAAEKVAADVKAAAAAQAELEAKAKARAQVEAAEAAKVKDYVKNIFVAEVDSEVIHKKLAAVENRDIQIDFDHQLAVELSKGDCDSADYFRASWKTAYSETLNKYGLFTAEQNKKSAENLFKSEEAINKKSVR